MINHSTKGTSWSVASLVFHMKITNNHFLQVVIKTVIYSGISLTFKKI